MPVEADAVANAVREDFRLAAVRVHSHDRGEALVVFLADVAGRAHRDVEHPVGTEGDELPAMEAFRREPVVDDDRIRRAIETSLDVVEA